MDRKEDDIAQGQKYISPARAVRYYAERFSGGEDILSRTRDLLDRHGNQGLAYKARRLNEIVESYVSETQNFDEAAHQLELLYGSLAPMMSKASWRNAKGAKEMKTFLNNSLKRIEEYANKAELNKQQKPYQTSDSNSERISVPKNPMPERVLSSEEYRREYPDAAAGSDAIPILILNARSGRRPHPTLRQNIGRHIGRTAEKLGKGLRNSASYILGAAISLGATFSGGAPTLENYVEDSEPIVAPVEKQSGSAVEARRRLEYNLGKELTREFVLGFQEKNNNETYIPSEITNVATQMTSPQVSITADSKRDSYKNIMGAVRANLDRMANSVSELDDGKTPSPLWRKAEAVRDASLRRSIDMIMEEPSKNGQTYFANISRAEMKDGILLPIYEFEILPEAKDNLLPESFEDNRTFGEIVGTFRDNLRMDAIAEQRIKDIALASETVRDTFPEYAGMNSALPVNNGFELTPLELAEQTGINGLLKEQITITENQIRDYQEYIANNGGVRPEFIASDGLVENEEWVAPVIPQSFELERAEDAMALRMRTPFSHSLVVDSKGKPIIQAGKPNLEGYVPLDGIAGRSPDVLIKLVEKPNKRLRPMLGAGDSFGEGLFGNR